MYWHIVISSKIIFDFLIQNAIWSKVWLRLLMRIKAYEHEYGRQEVETFLDAVLAIQEHIDPH